MSSEQEKTEKIQVLLSRSDLNDLFVFIVESLKMFYNLLGSLHPEFSDSSS